MDNLFEGLKANKLFWVAIIFTAFNVGVFFVGKMVIDKAADKVIERLQKDYSPSPYGPGLDPDKVNPNAEARQRLYYELKQEEAGKPVTFEEPSEDQVWRADWESERGFNP